ncbi:MAG: hypothetical protein AB8F65_09995 [Woeseiaceae bacterium]
MYRDIAIVLAIAIACLQAPALADEPTTNSPIAAIGGLTLIPQAFRYRPTPISNVYSDEHVALSPVYANPTTYARLTDLDDHYTPNRQSFLNTIRSRRGLSLLTLYETRDRCLFFGISERGFAGINFLPVRTLARRENHRAFTALEQAYLAVSKEPVRRDADGTPLLLNLY